MHAAKCSLSTLLLPTPPFPFGKMKSKLTMECRHHGPFLKKGGGGLFACHHFLGTTDAQQKFGPERLLKREGGGKAKKDAAEAVID